MGNVNEMPQSWIQTTLGNISLINPKLNLVNFSDDLEISFIPMAAVETESGKVDLTQTRKLGSVKKGYTPFIDGDVIFAKITPCMENGKIAFLNGLKAGIGFGSTEFHVSRPLNNISRKLIFYFLVQRSYRKDAQGNMTGSAGQLRVSTIFFRDSLIPLPPLREQHRIVAKIEELFSELDKGVEALKTAQQQLKVYRQAVLNSAIAGDTSKTIEEVVVSLDQGWSPKCYNEPSGNHQEWGVIKTTAIQAGYFQEMENKRLPEDLQPRTQHELKKGDLLITRAGPRVRVGICCLVKKIRPRLLNCDKVYRIRTNTKVAIPEYIEILLNSPKYSREIEKMKTGISDSGVNLTQKGLLKIVISIPSIEQQIKIVQEIETRLSVADKLEETIAQSLQQAEALRQSILKKAFAGKLVPQDPNDEPAAKLLERIKAEKAAQTPVQKTRKKKATL